jgi:mannose-6-phosphate isomerase-like protein (cupin superfamily)
MEDFELSSLLAELRRADDPYLEFLRVPSLSVGLYTVPAGGADRQAPHTEDEVYYVLEGRAKLRIEQEDREVGPGSLIYVGANADHRFHNIEQDLTILVFFAPAEDTHGPPATGS